MLHWLTALGLWWIYLIVSVIGSMLLVISIVVRVVRIVSSVRDLRKWKRSLCLDNCGPRGLFCVLEPGHRGDHKHFRSNGGMIGWPNKAGV